MSLHIGGTPLCYEGASNSAVVVIVVVVVLVLVVVIVVVGVVDAPLIW